MLNTKKQKISKEKLDNITDLCQQLEGYLMSLQEKKSSPCISTLDSYLFRLESRAENIEELKKPLNSLRIAIEHGDFLKLKELKESCYTPIKSIMRVVINLT